MFCFGFVHNYEGSAVAGLFYMTHYLSVESNLNKNDSGYQKLLLQYEDKHCLPDFMINSCFHTKNKQTKYSFVTI